MELHGGNNGFLRFNKDIRGLDDPHINGGIDSTKIIYPEPQAGKKIKREKIHSQSKRKQTKSSEHKKLEKTLCSEDLVCFFLLCEWTFSLFIFLPAWGSGYIIFVVYSPIYERVI
jgi:hypothetical protein